MRAHRISIAGFVALLVAAIFLTAIPPARAQSGYEIPGVGPGPQTPIIFVDALKQSTPWMSSSPLALDGDGQVTALARGQSAWRLVYASGQRHPAGEYALLYDGSGAFVFDGATVVSQQPGKIVVAVSSPTQPIVLHLVAVDARDPARNVRLTLPGFEDVDRTQPFYPPFVRSLAGADMLRFAVWSNAQTNVASSVWPLRPRISRVTQAMAFGVAPEYEIALANATGADPWFVVPVGATDGYVYGIASLVHGLLDPRLHPIFEYGDRVWSDGTPENAYARMAARNTHMPGDGSTGALEWYAYRSARISSIVDAAFGRDASRVSHIVSIPASRDARSARADRVILTFANAGRRAQMLVVDATDDAAFANSRAIAASLGGPLGFWRPDSDGLWRSDGVPARAAIATRPNLVFASGSDSAPLGESTALRARRLAGMSFPEGRAASRTLGGAPSGPVSLPANATSTDPLDELTYHNDLFRSGWYQHETILNNANVKAPGFGRIRTLDVDGNVLAQPLYIHQYSLPGGPRDIVVVVTEHDSVYEFDADTSALINHVNIGTSQSSSDVGCGDISPEYGITSTPVIDRASGRIYLVAASEPKPFVFRTKIHALDIATLKDQIPPVELTASTVLSNGSVVKYDPQNQQTRASLMLSGGSLYVGVGSHCDNNAGNIVGWMLRYDSSLHQTARFATTEDTDSYLLSSVWMTGFAPAADGAGNIYVVTGNGSFDADHAGGRNFGESVLRLPPDLSAVTDFFTPANWNDLNNGDVDFGSGGVMLLPQVPGAVRYTAVAQGKFSTIYLLNRSHLGRVKLGDSGALQTIPNTGNGVWGGPAFYGGVGGWYVYYQADSAPLVSFLLAPNNGGIPQLTFSSSGTSNAAYGGSLPIVSSLGRAAGTGIVWLVKRSTPLRLEAYDATDVSRLLFSADAGSWSNPQNNGFLTPLVANGKVYVPSTDHVQVFGLNEARQSSPVANSTSAAGSERRLTGIIVRVESNMLTLRLRDGRVVAVDIGPARAARHLGVLPLGRAVVVYGWVDKTGTFHVASVGHTSQDPAAWSPDLYL